MESTLDIKDPIFVLKWLTTFYHGCDRHSGDWIACPVGICEAGREAMVAVEELKEKAWKYDDLNDS